MLTIRTFKTCELILVLNFNSIRGLGENCSSVHFQSANVAHSFWCDHLTLMCEESHWWVKVFLYSEGLCLVFNTYFLRTSSVFSDVGHCF